MKQMRARKPDNAIADREFSAKVLGRDGRVCRMERWDGEKWRPHLIKGSPLNPIDAAHIESRNDLSPETRFRPQVGIAACRNCHTLYDTHDKTVRVPPDRYDVCRKMLERAQILGEIKILPPRREPQKRPTE